MNKKEEFFEKYFSLISQVDKEVSSLEKYYKLFNYECTSGCTYHSECCKVPLKIYPIELESIKYKMNQNKFPFPVNTNNNKSICNYLIDDKCTIYEFRPVICRIFGIIHKRNDTIIGPDCGIRLLERLKEKDITPIKFLNSDIIFEQIEKLNREFLHFNKQFQLVKFEL